MTKPFMPYDIYDNRCPTRDMLARLADKWALLVLARLENGSVLAHWVEHNMDAVLAAQTAYDEANRPQAAG